jgi:hypothetical protein
MAAWPAFLVADEIPDTRQGHRLRIAAALAAIALSLVLIRRWTQNAFIG